jgi:hypothetical protein
MCAADMWAWMQTYIGCYNNRIDLISQMDQWAMTTTTTAKPYFETTTTAEQRLYNEVVNYQTTTTVEAAPAAPAPVATSSPNLSNAQTLQQLQQDFNHHVYHDTDTVAERADAIFVAMWSYLSSKDEDAYNRMCNDANRMPSKQFTSAERDSFKDDLVAALPMCHADPELELWNAMDKAGTSKTVTSHILSHFWHPTGAKVWNDYTLWIHPVEVDSAVTAMCADYQNNAGAHLAHWMTEYNNLDLDIAYLETVQTPPIPTYHEGQDSRALEEAHPDTTDMTIARQFYELTDPQKDAYCGVAANYVNKEILENWWTIFGIKSFHYDDLMFWTTRMGRTQNWGLMALQAVSQSPRSLLKAFLVDEKTAKKKCGEVVNAAKAQVNDIWNAEYMLQWKEHQVKTRYLMKKCNSMQDRKLEEVAEERALEKVWSAKNEICASIDSWKSEQTVTVGAGGDMSVDEFLQAVVQCGDKVQTWLGSKYNQKIDYPDEKYCEDHIYSRLANKETIMLKKWAYWEFNEKDRHFPCFEHHFVAAHTQYIDTTVHTCSLMSNINPSVYAGMEIALEKDKAADMDEVAAHVKHLYTTEYKPTKSEWSAVTRGDDGKLTTVEIPGLVVHFAAVADASGEEIVKAIQDVAEVGLASEVDGSHAKFTDISESEAVARMQALVNLKNNGFTIKGNKVEVTEIAFPAHYEDARAHYKKIAGSDAGYVEYVCAINPNAADGIQLRTGVASDSAAPASSTQANPAAVPAEVTPAGPSPTRTGSRTPASTASDSNTQSETSSSEGITLMALSATALMML